jgi:hypothetical protein
MNKAYNKGGSIALDGLDGTDGKLINIKIENGGTVRMTPNLATTPTAVLHYAVKDAVEAPTLADCCGHMVHSLPTAATPNAPVDRVEITVPAGTTKYICLLLCDNANAAKAGGESDYLQYEVFTR